MSTMHKMHAIQLSGARVPSHALIMRMLAVSLAAGHQAIDLEWRGQRIELTFHDNAKEWRGLGSIDTESGHHIARELNDIRDFVVRHFQYIGIGHA